MIDLYRQAGLRAGHPAENLIVGMHAFGYVAETTEQAVEEMFAEYVVAMSGAFLLGNPEEVADKIKRHSDALGGLVRVTFQMDT